MGAHTPSRTIILPSGRRLRTGTIRRYIVVDDYASSRPEIEYRTDNRERALKCATTSHGCVAMDTHTGEQIR